MTLAAMKPMKARMRARRRNPRSAAEGASLCYRTICVEDAALLGRHAHPEVSMHTPSLADYEACFDGNDWMGVGALMLASAHKLAKIGADFLEDDPSVAFAFAAAV